MSGRSIPRSGEIYRHFKNKLYQIVTVATHTETGEQLVVYEALYDDFKTYARPLAEFLSETDHKKYPKVAQFYRFELVEREIDGTLRMGYPIKVKELVYPQEKEVKQREVQKEKEKLDMSSIVQEVHQIEQEKETTVAEDGNSQQKVLESIQTEAEKRNSQQNEKAEILKEDDDNQILLENDESEMEKINPFLLEFLDTDTYSEKLQVLVSIRSRLDDRLIDDMATAIDVIVEEGPLPERYEGLKTCLETRMKFECERLR